MTPLTQLSLLRFFREGRVGGPQIDAPPPLKLWRTGDWRRSTLPQRNAKNTKGGKAGRGVRRMTLRRR